MKKMIWVIVVVALAVGMYIYIRRQKEDKPASITTERMHTGGISNSITATGIIQPVDTVAIGAQVSGTIKNIYVDFNSIVKKGELLASLDKSLFIDQVNQNLGNLQNAQSTLEYQQQNFDRQSKLYKVGAISQADFETAQSLHRSAIAAAASAKALLSVAQRNLFYTDIHSPINGTVLSRNVSEGQTIASSFNTPTLFSIAKDLTKMQVNASVDEADIGNVKRGQPVNFTVDAFPDDVFEGTVQAVRLQPVVVANVVTYTTVINAQNDNLKLKPGMTANVTIFLQQDSSAQLISAKALNFNPDSTLSKQYQIVKVETNHSANTHPSVFENSNIAFPPHPATVWVLETNKMVQKNVMIGMNDNINAQVLSGLNAGDRVIDGIQMDESAKKNAGAEKSPFMPSRKRETPGKGNAPTK